MKNNLINRNNLENRKKDLIRREKKRQEIFNEERDNEETIN